MAGPYNIDDDINAGDPGQLAWAESVAQAVNDLDLRVGDVESSNPGGVPLARKPGSTPTWRSPFWQDNSNSNAGEANRLYLFEFPVYWPVAVDGLGARVQGIVVGGQFRLAVYADADGVPGDLVASTSALDGSTADWAGETFTPVTMSPGLYYVGFIVSDTGVAFHRAHPDFVPFLAGDAGTGAIPSVAVGNDGTGHYWDQGSFTLPSTIGTAGTGAGANGENIRPVIYLRLAGI